MAIKPNVELRQDGETLVKGVDIFASRCLFLFLVLFFLLAPISIGLYHANWFLKSPLIRLVSWVSGYIVSGISCVFSLLTSTLIFGQYEFTGSVLKLYSSPEFRVATALLFLSLLFSVFFVRLIDRIFTGYEARTGIFCMIFLFVVGLLGAIFNFLSSVAHPYVYVFNFVIAGILYIVLFALMYGER